MKRTDALACAKRSRESSDGEYDLVVEIGERISNALTMNVEHHLILIIIET